MPRPGFRVGASRAKREDAAPTPGSGPGIIGVPPIAVKDVLPVAYDIASLALQDMAASGPTAGPVDWWPLDDYVEEERRHRRVEARSTDDGFQVRAVFSSTLPYENLLEPDGTPPREAEWIRWSHGPGVPYVVEIHRPDRGTWVFHLPVPAGVGRIGPISARWARELASIRAVVGPARQDGKDE